jgi:hypothetical protein
VAGEPRRAVACTCFAVGSKEAGIHATLSARRSAPLLASARPFQATPGMDLGFDLPGGADSRSTRLLCGLQDGILEQCRRLVRRALGPVSF